MSFGPFPIFADCSQTFSLIIIITSTFLPLGNRIFSFLTPLLVFLFLFARPCSLFLFPLFFCPKLLELSWTSHLTINYIIYNLGGKTLIFLSLLFFFTRVNYIIYLRYSMLVSLVVFTLA